MGMLWTVHVRNGADQLAESQTQVEFCHTPRRDETQILCLRLKAGGWQRFDCRLVSLVNASTHKEITVDILGVASPSVV